MKSSIIKVLLAIAATAALPAVASATQTIAHRGVFHDVSDQYALPENSLLSIIRAKNMGLAGVELDLRLSSDGVVMVTHDQIANRTTRFDGSSNRKYDPIDGLTGWKPHAVWINEMKAGELDRALLKAYGRDGRLMEWDQQHINDDNHAWDMHTLDAMFTLLKKYRSDVLSDHNFKIILDIQDANIFQKAAKVVNDHGLRDYVYLKFFVSKGLWNDPRYHGSETCYEYAREHGLSGMKIIPQINDGELDINEDDQAGIDAFQTRLTVHDFLQCWSDAQAQHGDAAQMPIVSASVPKDNSKATKAAATALHWASQHHRQTMSIIPNPDAGRMTGSGSCQTYTWQSTAVVPAKFNYDARMAKQHFVDSVKPDYVIIDIMGDASGNSWKSDLWSFEQNLCR